MKNFIALAVLLFLSGGTPQADVDSKLWAVIPTKCPIGQIGGRLQQAIDAANDGDTVLLTGDAQQITISGKSLTLTTETGGTIRRLTISNLQPGQSVVVEGLTMENEVIASPAGFFAKPTLFIDECEGSVLIERCVIRAGSLITPSSVLPARGAFVRNSDDVTFNRCTIKAGKVFDGIDPGVLGATEAPGLHCSDSQLYLYECDIVGGENAKSPSVLTSVAELIGGAGIEVNGGFLFIDGGQVSGGKGTYQDMCGDDNPFGPGCLDFAMGGNGLDGATNSLVWTRDTTLVGGLGGDPFGAGDGIGLNTTGGLVALSGSNPELEVDGPFDKNDPIELVLRGNEGDLVEVRAGDFAKSIQALGEAGIDHIDNPFFTDSFGPLPVGGELTVTLNLDPLPAGYKAQGTYLQAEFFDGVATKLSNSTHITVYNKEAISLPNHLLLASTHAYANTQAAIDCAKDGEAILATSGGNVVIDGKSLTVVGVNGQTSIISMIVKNIPADKQVILRRLRFSLQDTPDPEDNLVPLIILNCEGPVLVEECTLVGNTSLAASPTFQNSTQAVRIINSASVTFVRCFMRGGSSQFNFGSKFAVRSALSNAAFYNCTMVGGVNNGSGPADAKGRAAVRFKSGQLIMSDCTLKSFQKKLILTGATDYWYQDMELPSIKDEGFPKPVITSLPGKARKLQLLHGAVPVGTQSKLKVIGEPLDVVVLSIASDLSFLPILKLSGVQSTTGMQTTHALGALPDSGGIDIPVFYDQLDGFSGHLGLLMQAVFMDTSGQSFLSNPTYAMITNSMQ